MAKDRARRSYGMSLRLVVIAMFVAGIVVSGMVLRATFKVTQRYDESELATREYLNWQEHIYTIRDVIHSQNDHARNCVVSGNQEDVILFFNEVQVERTVDRSLEALQGYLVDEQALRQLDIAALLRDQLYQTQCYAMRLALEAHGLDLNKQPDLLSRVQLSEEDLALSPDQQREKALEMLFSKEYTQLNSLVDVRINFCRDTLFKAMSQRQEENSVQLQRLLAEQRALAIELVVTLLLVLLFVLILVVNPINSLVRSISGTERVPTKGSSEIRFLAETYNRMHDEMEAANHRLSYEAAHDALTGLYNRTAYEALRRQSGDQDIGLLIVDVDQFKQINDTYGHDIGDRVLVRVARVLQDSFRDADKVCRIGGDEFSVIMVGAGSAVTGVIRRKFQAAAQVLGTPDGDIPPVTISVGCAFSDQLGPNEDLFKNADRALYAVKASGRNGCRFYPESEHGDA